MHACPSGGLERAEPVKKPFVLLPAWDRLDWGRLIDFLKRLAFHLEIRSRVNLSRFDVHVAEEVADHVERDSALQQVHSLCVAKRVGAYGSVQSRTLASCRDDIFVKDVADSRTRQSLMACVVEERFVELFGAIQLVFLHVTA